MDGRQELRAAIEIEDFAAQMRHRFRAAERAADRGRTERHDQSGLEQGAFAIEPPTAGADLAGVGLFVQTALAARIEFEMFHRIGDEAFVAGDAGALKRGVEELAGGPDEWPPGPIFHISRLLADEQHAGVRRSFSRNDLSSVFIERTTRAGRLLLGERRKRSRFGQ